MSKKDFVIGIVLFFIGISSRLPLIEHFQSHWDGPQYSIAIVRYSLEQETPAMPGYPLYIAMGRFFYTFTKDPHAALLAVSVLWSGIGAFIFFIAGKNMFNRVVGIISASIFLSGSTFYYFGLTPYAYLIIAVTTTILAFVCHQIIFKKKELGILLGAFFALALGIRPQEILFISPLVLLGFLYLPTSGKIKAAGSFIIFFFAWFIPFTNLVGGFQKYMALFLSGAKEGSKGVFLPKIRREYFELVIKGIGLSIGIGVLAGLFYIKKMFEHFKSKAFWRRNTKYILFFSCWIFPSLLFNLLIVTVHAGYQMHFLSAFTFLVAYGLWRAFYKNKRVLYCSAGIIVIINLALFFYNRDPQFKTPYRYASFHYWDLRKNDIKIGSKVAFVEKHFSADNTLIITTPYFWRPFMYYLKPYQFYEFDALVTDDPQFENLRRTSKDWNRTQFSQKNHVFSIPENISTVVFLDDEVNLHLISIQGTQYQDGLKKVVAFKVNPGETYSYGLNYIKKL